MPPKPGGLAKRITTGRNVLVVTLAAARGFHGPQMSELAFIFMLHFMRDFRDLFATQTSHRWNRVEQSLLEGRTAVIEMAAEKFGFLEETF